LPILDTSGSDSAMLDNALELLALSGRDTAHALMMLVPEAWEKVRDLPPAWKAFYHYHSTLMEPWDGPAALAFSDGRVAGMALDRNGLRPARYVVMDDGLVVAGSESGAYEADPARVMEKGKLGPGQMILADLAQGKVWHNDEIKEYYASRHPYQDWLTASLHKIDSAREDAKTNSVHVMSQLPRTRALLLTQQAVFGYTDEELGVIVRHMAEDGVEPIASMGDDTPHAVLSEFERPLCQLFKQRFAEVTNPPIDPLREQLVMSTRVLLGAHGNILEESAAPKRLLELPSPFITDDRLTQICALEEEFPYATLDATFAVSQPGGASLERALDELCDVAERAVEAGKVVLILSDREVSAKRAPIPMLLATSAVHHHLLRVGKRYMTSIIAETGDARDVHHFACLIGFGANAVNPYLALASVRSMIAAGHSRKKELTPQCAEENFIHAAEKGLLKIMSKMGIATLDAYHGAQMFECLGLADSVVGKYFCGTPSLINGADLVDLAAEVLAHHAHAFAQDANHLKSYGLFKYKKAGEYHAYNPDAVRALNEAVRTPGALNGSYREAYEKYLGYAALVHARPATDLADHLDIQYGEPIPLENVEPVAAIVKRFSSAAMSHGALSLEAHKAVATALNRLGALSNSGEGGEHPSRYGTESNSPIKQVASARFGVTPAYLMSADELQIKMAQGSKPGEGGQLPAHKVSVEIARFDMPSPARRWFAAATP
jgi:glutamate synthase (ferredoxin)